MFFLLQKLDVVHQSTNALVFLLQLKPEHVVHRDLKPANILLKSQDEGVTVRIADFGVSKTVTGKSRLDTKVGTESYRAPEMYDPKAKYDRAVDVFALGILILHLIRAKPRQRLDDDDVLGDTVGIGLTMNHNR